MPAPTGAAVSGPAAVSGFLATPRGRVLLAVAIVLATALVHVVALESAFKQDDFLHLYDRASLGYGEFLWKPHGGHLMVAHKLLLDLLLRAFGPSSTAILAAFLLLHLVNAVLLQSVLVRFTGRPVLSALVALAWSTAPVHQETIAWMSTTGHVLVGTFLLLVLREIGGLVRSGGTPSHAALLRWSVLLLGAIGSFGVGLTIAASAPLWIWLLLGEGTLERRKWIPLFAVVALAFGAYLIARRSGRDVTRMDLAESLPAVLGLFARLTAYGFAAVAGASPLTARPDDLAVWPLGELGLTRILVLSAVVSLVLALVLVRAFVAGDRSTRRLILGCVLVSCAAYGAVALGRGSSVFGKGPEWFATRAKYHYASPLGFLLALGLALSRMSLKGPIPAAAGVLAVALVATNAAAARQMGDDLAAESRQAAAFVERGLSTAAGEAPAGEVYLSNAPFLPARRIVLTRRQEASFPGIFAYCAFAHPGFEIEGRELFFVEEDAEVVEATRAQRRAAVAEHLLSPGQAIARGARAIHDIRSGRTSPARER